MPKEFFDQYPTTLYDVLGDPPDEIRMIGRFIDGHGISTGTPNDDFLALLNLLENGIDEKRRFHTVSLMHLREDASYMHAMGAVYPFSNGIAVVCGEIGNGKPGRLIEEGGIKFVVLAPWANSLIPLFSHVFQPVRFIRADQLYEYIKQHKNKA